MAINRDRALIQKADGGVGRGPGVRPTSKRLKKLTGQVGDLPHC
jgi:hypothetical protein